MSFCSYDECGYCPKDDKDMCSSYGNLGCPKGSRKGVLNDLLEQAVELEEDPPLKMMELKERVEMIVSGGNFLAKTLRKVGTDDEKLSDQRLALLWWEGLNLSKRGNKEVT